MGGGDQEESNTDLLTLNYRFSDGDNHSYEVRRLSLETDLMKGVRLLQVEMVRRMGLEMDLLKAVRLVQVEMVLKAWSGKGSAEGGSIGTSGNGWKA